MFAVLFLLVADSFTYVHASCNFGDLQKGTLAFTVTSYPCNKSRMLSAVPLGVQNKYDTIVQQYFLCYAFF